MDTAKIQDAIPDQETGGQTDTHHSVTADSIEDAKKLFARAKNRLEDINSWHQFSGKASAEFQLTDPSGNEVNRKAQKGDHFKINIPAPGSQAGEGNDWVVIEEIEDKTNPAAPSESFVIRVRPAENPRTTGNDVAHFFKDDATSSFAVQREELKVTASVHGRNEVPNTKTTGLIDKVRNAVVALGAIAGLSTPQWKSLVNGLLDDE